jgi:hypothetical protein
LVQGHAVELFIMKFSRSYLATASWSWLISICSGVQRNFSVLRRAPPRRKWLQSICLEKQKYRCMNMERWFHMRTRAIDSKTNKATSWNSVKENCLSHKENQSVRFIHTLVSCCRKSNCLKSVSSVCARLRTLKFLWTSLQLEFCQFQEVIATSDQGFLSSDKIRDAVGCLAIRLGDRTHQRGVRLPYRR